MTGWGRTQAIVIATAACLAALVSGGPSSTLAAFPPPGKTLVIAPIRIEGEGDYRWLSPALTESLVTILKRTGQEIGEEPQGRDLPGDVSALSRQAVIDWLGKDSARGIAAAVFGSARISGGRVEIILRIFDLAEDRPADEYRASADMGRVTSMLPGMAGAVLDHAATKPAAEAGKVAVDYASSTEAFRLFGESYLSGDLEERLKKLETAVEAERNYTGAWMQLGLVRYAQGKHDGAREAFEKVTVLSPRFKEAFNNLGVIFSEEGEVAKALKAFRDALSVDERYFDARFNLAKLLDQEHRNEDALREYELLIKSSPERPQLRFLRALLLDRLGKPREALDAFREISAADPSLAEEFFLQKGKEARQEKRYKDADAFFTRALDINASMRVVQRERGINSYLAGEYEKSVGFFLEAARKEPESAEVQHYLGLALGRTGKFAEASAAFRRAVELGNVKESNFELAKLQFEEGKFADSVASLNRYLKAEPESEEGKDLLSRATRKISEETQLARQKADFAMQRLDKMDEIVNDLNRRNSELETKLALILEQAGRLQEENDRLRAGIGEGRAAAAVKPGEALKEPGPSAGSKGEPAAGLLAITERAAELEAARKKIARLEGEISRRDQEADKAAARPAADCGPELAASEERLKSALEEARAAVAERNRLEADMVKLDLSWRSRLGRETGNNGPELEAMKRLAFAALKDLADLESRKGSRKKAEEIYLLLIEKDPANGAAYLALGGLYFRMGDRGRSEEMYRKAAYCRREGTR